MRENEQEMKIREWVRLHLLQRLQRRAVDYHHYHLVMLLATYNNKQGRPCCTNRRLGWIRQTNKHKHTRKHTHTHILSDINVSGFKLVVLSKVTFRNGPFLCHQKPHFAKNKSSEVLQTSHSHKINITIVNNTSSQKKHRILKKEFDILGKKHLFASF